MLPIAEGTYYRKHGDSFPEETAGSKPSAVTLIVNEADKDLLRLSSVLRSQLEDLEITCTVTAYKTEEYGAAVAAGNYDFALLNLQIGLWPDLYELFASDGSLNYNKYSDASGQPSALPAHGVSRCVGKRRYRFCLLCAVCGGTA